MRSMILLLVVAACFPACSPTGPSTAPSAVVTREQFQEIRWIVGRWRGAEAGGPPFFESYRLVDDSTLQNFAWSDSTFSNPIFSSVISLRNDLVTSSLLNRGDSVSVRFYFEKFNAVDDSTLRDTNWLDSISRDPYTIWVITNTDTSSSSIATKWDGASVHFEPNGKAGNTFTWRKESADRWSAQLFWNDKSGAPQTRTYAMTRVAQ
ncbi:MAG: hypothetical protein ABI599_11320 [Flavobacteriales bacterium]